MNPEKRAGSRLASDGPTNTNEVGTITSFINNTKYRRWVSELTRHMCQ
jgi:hypothetical protein